MIASNELRIGNWVEMEPNGIWKTRTMLGEEASIVNTNDNKRRTQVMARDMEHIQMNESHYFPIPLTPEILEKCGFENITHFKGVPTGVYKKNGLKIGLNGDDFVNAQYSVIFGDDIYVKVKFLHQLQNLYFALTGEDLEVKL